jgi:GxxExxY protein
MYHHEEHQEHEGKGFDKLSHRVIGCAIEAHRLLAPGLLESSYQRCLGRELELSGIVHTCETPLELRALRVLRG